MLVEATTRAGVLHLITRLDLGGAQKNTLHTVQHLDPERFDARLLCGRGGILDGEARRSTRVTFCSNLVHPISPGRDGAALAEIWRMIASRRASSLAPLVVHTHCSKAGVLGRIIARSAGADVVVHTFHGLGYHADWAARRAFQGTERAIRGRADAFFFVSRRDMQDAERIGLLGRTPAYLVRSGIDLRAFHHSGGLHRSARAELGIGLEDRVVVTVANFKRVKNPLLGLSAFARVAAKDPHAKWVFVGGGDRSTFDCELRRLRLVPRVRVLGWRQDVPRLLAAGDVFMLSSDYEGLPRSILEALASGLPVVATDAGGTSEVIDDRTGMVVPTGDADALAAGVLRMLAAAPNVRGSAPEILAEFDIHAMVRRQESIYEELIDRKVAETATGKKGPVRPCATVS